MPDYSPIDQPSILRYIFYPRKEFTSCPQNAFDLFVPVEEAISIACRFYAARPDWPWILFFHGNGEVVSDYDSISPFYHQQGLNLVVADYRGYGASGGVPTLGDLVRDAQTLYRRIREELSRRGFRKDLWLMGRSLGSLSALELAQHHQDGNSKDGMRGLIIESGFASIVRILRHLGFASAGMDLGKIEQACLENLRRILIPTLIIHGQLDLLVPIKEAEDLYQHLGAERKELLIIPLADHNNIMLVGFKDYFKRLQQFIKSTDLQNHM